MFMSDWSALMTPQKATLDSMHTLSWFISYRRLSPQFQFSLSAAALGMYLYGPLPLPPCGFISFRVVSNCGCSTTPLQRWWGEGDWNIKQNWLSSLHVSVQLTEVYRQICFFSGYSSYQIRKIYLETMTGIWKGSVHLTEIWALRIMLSWNGQFVQYRNMPSYSYY